MDIVTGYTGTPHITAQQDRMINRGVFGEDSYILPVGERLATSIYSATQIKVLDGAVSVQGCVGVITHNGSQRITVTGGESGYNQNKLLCVKYNRTTSGIESMSLVIVAGSLYSNTDYDIGDPGHDPSVVEYHIDETNALFFPIYRICFSETSLHSVVRLAEVLPSLADYKAEKETTALTVTRVSNTYCVEADVAMLHAYKRSGMLFFNGNLSLTAAMASGATSEQIASISGWNACDTVYITAPALNGSGTLGITVGSTGNIHIVNVSGTAASGYHRFSVCVPVAE